MAPCREGEHTVIEEKVIGSKTGWSGDAGPRTEEERSEAVKRERGREKGYEKPWDFAHQASEA